MYKFYLDYNNQKTEIPEPIGWDNLELVLKRNDKSHGIDVEYSELSLKFYGDNAISILEDAYSTDIDCIVIFTCENDEREEYHGQLDFEVYNKVYEDGYCYITAKVADIGVQVLFNNRIEQKVDINSLETFDGVMLDEYPMLRYNVELPSKEMALVSQLSNTHTDEQSAEFVFIFSGTYYSVCFQPGVDIIINELDSAFDVSSKLHFRVEEIRPNIFFRFLKEGNITYNNIELSLLLHFKIKMFEGFLPDPDIPFNSTKIEFIICKNNEDIYMEEVYNGADKNEIEIMVAPPAILLELKENDSLLYYFRIYCRTVDGLTIFSMKCHYEVYEMRIEIKSLTLMNSTTANISLLHETLSRITESITDNQITVKSDYYGRKDSDVNPTETSGAGSFRGLTTGLRIRNIKVLDESENKEIETKFTLSFSDVIKSLKAIDNIGYGFVKEDEIQYLRIENWEWFYKDDILFEIKNPGKIERGINPNEIFSTFKCGYKKYETESYNGLDAFHTEREYRTRLKLKKNEMEQVADFIADGYTIEYTRRKSVEQTTDWRYDNDVFIFCLTKPYKNIPDYYIVDIGADNTDNTVISPQTVYNVRISPARMAKKWLNRLLSFGFGKEEELIFTAGTGNLQAKGSALPNNFTELGFSTDNDNGVYTENQDFKSDELILLPELIKIPDYPVKVDEYKIIKENPYGIILVDGIPCYISDIKYKKQKNTASFVLIPKKV